MCLLMWLGGWESCMLSLAQSLKEMANRPRPGLGACLFGNWIYGNNMQPNDIVKVWQEILGWLRDALSIGM